LIWAIALPVVQALVLAVVFSHIVGAGRPGAIRGNATTVYAAFVFAGMVPWSYFSTAFTAASTSVVDSSNLAQRIYFPRLVLPLVAVTTALYPLLITTAVFLALVAALGPGLDVRTLWVVPAIALDVALVVGLSAFVSAAQVYVRDIRFAVSAVMTVMFYLTPVIYPLTRLPGGLQRVLQLLPTAGPVELFREAVGGADPHVWRYVAATLVWTVVVGAAGLFVHCKRDRILTDLL
jgi:lipopolysaccharide transport system permease protein